VVDHNAHGSMDCHRRVYIIAAKELSSSLRLFDPRRQGRVSAASRPLCGVSVLRFWPLASKPCRSPSQRNRTMTSHPTHDSALTEGYRTNGGRGLNFRVVGNLALTYVAKHIARKRRDRRAREFQPIPLTPTWPKE